MAVMIIEDVDKLKSEMNVSNRKHLKNLNIMFELLHMVLIEKW